MRWLVAKGKINLVVVVNKIDIKEKEVRLKLNIYWIVVFEFYALEVCG